MYVQSNTSSSSCETEPLNHRFPVSKLFPMDGPNQVEQEQMDVNWHQPPPERWMSHHWDALDVCNIFTMLFISKTNPEVWVKTRFWKERSWLSPCLEAQRKYKNQNSNQEETQQGNMALTQHEWMTWQRTEGDYGDKYTEDNERTDHNWEHSWNLTLQPGIYRDRGAD